jgi:hypothetical protein
MSSARCDFDHIPKLNRWSQRVVEPQSSFQYPNYGSPGFDFGSQLQQNAPDVRWTYANHGNPYDDMLLKPPPGMSPKKWYRKMEGLLQAMSEQNGGRRRTRWDPIRGSWVTEMENEQGPSFARIL